MASSTQIQEDKLQELVEDNQELADTLTRVGFNFDGGAILALRLRLVERQLWHQTYADPLAFEIAFQTEINDQLKGKEAEINRAKLLAGLGHEQLTLFDASDASEAS